MPQSVIQRSFGSGELAPALGARADLAQYAAGLRICRNFLVLKGGGVANRPGLRFIAACKTNSPAVQLLRYESEIAGESVLIEAGVGYLRFFKNGAPVEVSGVPPWDSGTTWVQGDLVTHTGVTYYAINESLNVPPPNAGYWYPLSGSLYEIPHPFGANAFAWDQDGRVLTLTHPATRPHELIFQALTRWIVRPVDTAPVVLPPNNVVLTPGGSGTRAYAYVVTSAAAESYEESQRSGIVLNLGVAEPTPDAPHVLTWDAPLNQDIAEYYVYGDPYNNGVFGFLGTAEDTAFRDVGLLPDFGLTPPIARPLFTAAGDYPSASASHQQRRFFAHTSNSPDGVWASRVGFPANFGISSPLQDDDALTFRLRGSRHHHPVRHLLGLKRLVVLTDAGVWTIPGDAAGVLTPSAIHADQETYTGAAAVKPATIGNAILYVQARGSILHDVRFDQEVQGLSGRDLTVFSPHLFEGHTIRRLDYAHTPHSIVWAVRDDGVLLGLTYLRDQDVWGWHRHDTAGVFEDVCVIPEPGEDAIYAIVGRTIDGDPVRYLERLEPRAIVDFDADAFFVDSGLTYSGAPVNTVTGLDHLEGRVVAVVGDGEVVFGGNPDADNAADFTVTGGTLPVDLPASYSTIHAGLAIRYAEIETLELDVAGVEVRDRVKRVASVSLLLERSSRRFLAGPDVAHLRQVKVENWEPVEDAHTGQIEMPLTGWFSKQGRIRIRQVDPLPLTILGIIPNVDLGG